MDLTTEQIENRKKWIRALRSGRYKQCRSALRKRNQEGKLEYCCLGVMCNIENKKAWKESVRKFDPFRLKLYDYISSSKPPSKWNRKYGITAFDLSTLINMNDMDRKSFNEIADWLEADMKHRATKDSFLL